MDLLASTVLLAALSPLMLLIAALIKLRSKGPVLFKQLRVGQRAQPFHMLKFRSMQVNNDDRIHQAFVSDLIKAATPATGVFKIVDDPRVTPIGRFLRKTSLDELPQLWNVVRGEMSLVGPRPPLPYEVRQYKPGIAAGCSKPSRASPACGRSTDAAARRSTRWSVWTCGMPERGLLDRREDPPRDAGRGHLGQGRRLTPAANVHGSIPRHRPRREAREGRQARGLHQPVWLHRSATRRRSARSSRSRRTRPSASGARSRATRSSAKA